MPSVTITRLADSCVLVDDGVHATLVDPGSFTWDNPDFDMDRIVWIDRILITHAHRDHCSPEFVAALHEKFPDVGIQGNDEVVAQLRAAGVSATTDTVDWVEPVDAPHEVIPTGAAPPNLAFHISSVFTHPGDSRKVTRANPILAVPMMPPWSSMTEAIAWANRLRPSYVLPIHDWNLNAVGRQFVVNVGSGSLADGIELLDVGYFDEITVEI